MLLAGCSANTAHIERSSAKFDERECLANALQWHVEELVDGIVFKDSELPDNLLADGCLTEEECAGVRKKLDRKDQVRVLLSIIKGRDFDVMKRFLKHLKSQNENVAKAITGKFEQNKKDGVKCIKCVHCELLSQVNLKYIVDDLWRFNLIDDGLFNLIIDTDRPAGAQGGLWYEVVNSLNRICEQRPSYVRDILGKALTKKHHYHHLEKGVAWMISNYGGLWCGCESLNSLFQTRESLSLNSSSVSSRSLRSEFAADTQSDISSMMNQTEIVAVPAIRKVPKKALKFTKEKGPVQVQMQQDGIMPGQSGTGREAPRPSKP